MGYATLVTPITEAERVLRAAIEHFSLSLKPEDIVITIQTRGRKKNVLGWYWGKRWNENGTAMVHEINLCAEELRRGKDIGETLLHELAHAENAHLEIKDCSGVRHNKRFREMAECVGLVCNDKAHPRLGWGVTNRGPRADEFLQSVGFKEEAFHLRRSDETATAKGSRLRLWECRCPKPIKIRVARDEMNVTCNDCEHDFEIQE